MMDKCTLENILTLTKSLAMLYVNGTIESSNKAVRNVMGDGLKEVLKLQNELYKTMSEDGYYAVTNIAKKEIEKTLTKLTKGANA